MGGTRTRSVAACFAEGVDSRMAASPIVHEAVARADGRLVL